MERNHRNSIFGNKAYYVDGSSSELNLALEVDISGSKKPLIDIGIHCPNRKSQFRMIGAYLIRGLPLSYQRSDDTVNGVKFVFGERNAGARFGKLLTILPIGKTSIIAILVSDRTLAELFITAVADIGSFVEPKTAFFFKIRTGLIAGGAGSALNTAVKDLSADIDLFAVVAMNTEVLSIKERAFVVPVGRTVSPDFFGNGRGVFTKEFSDVFKRDTIIKRILDVETVLKGKMFLIAWDIFTHNCTPSTAVRREYEHTMNVCRSKYQLCNPKFYQVFSG